MVEFWFTATGDGAEMPGWMVGARLRGQISEGELVQVFGPLKSETPASMVTLNKPAIEVAAARRARTFAERPPEPIVITAADFSA